MELAYEETTTSQSITMKGGDGPLSYAKNSSLQKGVVDATKEMMIHAIADKLDMEKLCSEAFRIADFGCSTGPNTFFSMQNIIQAVEQKHRQTNPETALEFQLFFNDHSSNDFNTLFKSLPPSWPHFIAGVPGSFYGRLFPKSSIHIGHSANALQWLSKVPNQVVDCGSSAYNSGSIYCTGTESEVAKAFASQFENDMETFLNARAEELVNGGLIVILMGGIPDGISLSQTAIGKFYDLLGSCLVDLTNKGLIDEEKVKSFNLPLHFPTAKELKALIERNGRLCIESIDEMTGQVKRVPALPSTENYISLVRAGFEVLIKKHFGNEMVDEFFTYYGQKHLESSFVFGENAVDNTLISVILKRI
ncbi:putative S-adenosyl-L-methionine-dependent methyltransferases superfamily protein [Hibiscus syriacus]|uniref:S-adenosyl-L-methionine-dependent methyltransferases superfamily protein n=1 Tax=Hibiscus syriacus TaxID=106335 RepID=A0A6A2YJX4_HIBSY|nr:loganic acid O-methyltransferase-like [Hibiscus syriacus]KAE8679749.1 putative S-adenosyl-L-methionine-dependent methyltransferases superfamily protein [Hibiscus syriacus]